MHLAEVSSLDILHNDHQSTLLRSVPVENERCGSGRTDTFLVSQYKRLALGANPQLTIIVREVNGGKLSLLRLLERDVALQKWLTQGASGNALIYFTIYIQ